MVIPFRGSARDTKRKQLKKEFWPHDVPWRGPQEKGYFCSPRSLCLILQALSSKQVSGKGNPSMVYLELLSRHHGQGVIEMTHNEDHAYAAGYATARGFRTWVSGMKLLEEAGFIRAKKSGQRYSKVLLIHPSLAMKALHDAGKVDEQLWEVFRARQIEVKESGADVLTDSPKPKRSSIKKSASNTIQGIRLNRVSKQEAM
jgi:hypothetical protein